MVGGVEREEAEDSRARDDCLGSLSISILIVTSPVCSIVFSSWIGAGERGERREREVGAAEWDTEWEADGEADGKAER